MKTTIIRSLCHYLVFILAMSVSTVSHADLPALGGPSLMISRDDTSGTKGFGLDSNAAVAIINVSLSLRHWQNDVIAWNGHSVNNEATVYFGIGLLNLIEIQRGFSNAGTRTRIRMDITLSNRFPFASDENWGPFKKGIVLTPFVEMEGGKKVYGLGIGLALD